MTMASALHAGSPPYPTPHSFSRTSTEPSMNGIQHSHSTANSFDAQQSSNTSPTPTPPASRHQPQYQYNMLSFNSVNGAPAPAVTPRHSFHEANAAPLHQQYDAGQRAQIYTAAYSGVSVYETEIDGLAVMRRRNDSWLNATQILKLAGVEKGKRTKVLEKEILSGEHEKVQGGYGKYQGTWISYNRGVQFAKEYGVVEQMRPLLEYDMGQDGVSQAGAGNINTPTKEQAMAAQRKRNLLNGAADNRGAIQSPNGTFFKNISKSAANAVNAINKARFEPPAGVGRPANQVVPSSQQMSNSQESAFAGSSQQSMHSLYSDPGASTTQLDPALRTDGKFSANDTSMNVDEPPRKKARASFSQSTTLFDGSQQIYDTTMQDMPDDPFGFQQAAPGANLDYTAVGLPPLKQPSTSQAAEKQQMLSSLFFDSTGPDFSEHPALLQLSGEDLDIPIDQTGHTALHWAATLAKTSLLRALIEKGANMYRLNTGGETALIRAALTTNNLDQGSFPELLELLGPTMEIRDGRGRTVLHHIAVSSAVKGPKRSSACRYYLEALLEYVVRSGSVPSSQANSFHDSHAPVPGRPIGLARFMSEIVNATDLSGDTALNLAARIGNRSIIQQLLEVGANPAIPNRGGLRPIDFGVAGETINGDSETLTRNTKHDEGPVSRVAETSQELVNTLKSFISETETSFNAQMQSKQSLIDQTTAKLRETTLLLNEESQRLAELQRKADERSTLRERIDNLRKANTHFRQRILLDKKTGPPRRDTKVGEADAGLEIDATILPPHFLRQLSLQNQLSNSDISVTHHLSDMQKQYVASLPHPSVLRARITAYRRMNASLGVQDKALKSKSSGLEVTLRKVVALSTGVAEDKVDELAGGLLKAVLTDKSDEMEVGRVREFLRRVESGIEV